ncbi:MAG: prepilin peptidase [Clostridiales bacterium]|nr:prepilin peptidase [Clostridiales bacterium]
MTTDKTSSCKLIQDLRSVPSPVFYIFAAVAVFCSFFVLGFTLRSIFTALFILALVACASADINKGIVPDLMLIFIAALAIVNFFVTEGFSTQGLLDHLIGAVCMSVPMLIIALLVKGAFGGGDIKLMAAAGLYLAWRYTVAGAIVGMFISGFYGMYLLLIKKAGARAKMKLAPFLAYGLATAALFGDRIIALLSLYQ